jgi:3-aminobutyryl-CoA ammonia-lyase
VTNDVTASLRVRLSQADAHYGGGLVAGGRLMELLGDVATELCIRAEGDEGLFAGYSDVRFLRPCYAGDFLEAIGEVTGRGETSLKMRFRIDRYARPRPDISDSAADLLGEPETVLEAEGTCVVPKDKRRRI